MNSCTQIVQVSTPYMTIDSFPYQRQVSHSYLSPKDKPLADLLSLHYDNHHKQHQQQTTFYQKKVINIMILF